MSYVALIRLPWPPQPLWPNRSHGRSWKAKDAAKAEQAEAASIAAYGQLGALKAITMPAIVITFHKADRGRYDLDNAFAALKPAMDAIFGRWGRDDSIINDVRLIRGEPIKGGCVMVEVSEAKHEAQV